MPELPEVETTRRGIEPQLVGKAVTGVIRRRDTLRYPIPKDLRQRLHHQTLRIVRRRGKYLLLDFDPGSVIIHLGMSGTLHIVAPSTDVEKHDHIDVIFGALCLRFRDPRRFGCVLWQDGDALQHPLLSRLGIEPLETTQDGEPLLSGDYLHRQSRKLTAPVKQFIMDSHRLVGVGNIYASEALFMAGIRPGLAAGRIGYARYQRLADAIKRVLTQAIAQGGTTLRDFTHSDGKPGYFRQELQVYGRAGEKCLTCSKSMIKLKVIGQRSTYYCPLCQR